MDVQIDIKKLLESLLLSRGKTVVDALKDQGLEWNGKEIVSIEPEPFFKQGNWYKCIDFIGLYGCEFERGCFYQCKYDNTLSKIKYGLCSFKEVDRSECMEHFRMATGEEMRKFALENPVVEEFDFPDRDVSETDFGKKEELTELDGIQKIIYNLLSSTNGEWLEEDYMTEMSKNISEDIRKQIAGEILTKRNIDTYIGQVKNARETIPYSHQTLIWNVLADLEDDLVELKKIKEG